MTATLDLRASIPRIPLHADPALASRRLPAPQPAQDMERVAQSKDRFLAFAFAASDMLVETGLDGVIHFAAGAFRQRFGRDGVAFLGRHVASLIAPGDQTAFAMALATMPLRGRIPPVMLRTNDAALTASAVAAMLKPGTDQRLCFTFGALPLPPTEKPGGAGWIADPVQFCREVEATLRTGARASLALLEVSAWQAGLEMMAAGDIARLRSGIGEVIGSTSAGSMAGALAPGRYGVLTREPGELAAMTAQLDCLLRISPASRLMRVEGCAWELSAGHLPMPQAARALRYGLSQFAAGGIAGAEAVGGGSGLSGIVGHATARAHTMREQIAAGRFRLSFQPVVSLADRAVQHYEALLRPVLTPGSTAQSAQDFVTFAEAVGLAEELDWAVLQQALATLRTAPGIAVAVNVSGLSMQSAGFRDRMLHCVTTQLPALARSGGRLLIELTETAEIEDLAQAASCLAGLRQAGVPVCLDDFGTGAANFRYLREFEVDYVKIDGAYIRAALESQRERGFVSSMVELATAVGAKVVAETIETEAQAALMRQLGVHLGQGWLFGRPGGLPGARR